MKIRMLGRSSDRAVHNMRVEGLPGQKIDRTIVYYWKKWDQIRGEMVNSKYPATREAIKVFQGVEIPGSGWEADASLLDGNGVLRPK